MYNPLLKTFIVVSESGSFQKAAAQLFISPPAVMKQINQLEHHLGLKLFERTGRGVVLTRSGSSVYYDAKEILRISSAAIERAYRFEEGRRFLIRVGSSLLYPAKPLFDLWFDCRKEYPNISLRTVPFIDVGNGDYIYTAIGSVYDLIFGTYDLYSLPKNCRFLLMGFYPFCISLPQSHRLAKKDRLLFSDLYGERLMILPPGISPVNDRLHEYLEKKHPQITLIETPSYYDVDVFNRCEEEGNLLLSLSHWNDINAGLSMVPLDTEEKIPYGIIYRSDSQEDVMFFLNIIEHYLLNAQGNVLTT